VKQDNTVSMSEHELRLNGYAGRRHTAVLFRDVFAQHLGWKPSPSPTVPSVWGHYSAKAGHSTNARIGREGCGKDARWKKFEKRRLSHLAWKIPPANPAGFPTFPQPRRGLLVLTETGTMSLY